MNTKTMITLSLKVIALTIILFLCFTVSTTVAGLAVPSFFDELPTTSTAKPVDMTVALLTVCAFQAIALSYPIVRSRWTGWQLTVTIFLVHYGIMTFLSEIEAILFLNYLVDVMPTASIPYLFIQGAIVAALFAPLAVLIHGKMKGSEQPQASNWRLVMPWTEWAWKLPLVAIAYVVIYFSFGFFVAMPLAGDAFQSYYGELQGPAWIPLLQLVRGIIWAVLALPVIRMMKGRWWEAGLAVASLYSVLMGFLLLLPNAFMPDAIRRAHFVEVSTSNFLFGWIVVWLLNRRHGSLRDLFRRSEGLSQGEMRA